MCINLQDHYQTDNLTVPCVRKEVVQYQKHRQKLFLSGSCCEEACEDDIATSHKHNATSTDDAPMHTHTQKCKGVNIEDRNLST